MNPRLYQAMDLLYMPLMELQQHLKEELLVNPFLEMADADEESEQDEVSLESKEETEEQNKDENEVDWENILLDGFHSAPTVSTFENREFYERAPVAERDLSDHLRDQIQLLDIDDSQIPLIEEILGNIGEDGYLKASLDEVVVGVNALLPDDGDGSERAQRARYTFEQAAEVLEIIQGLDPPPV